ncbi:MAG TPA: winged helix-turn-helix domain-containing protein [Candidatus Binatia bacterium]|nr:winged helix-turn-helix domain-containing protein [Candidatus Binatia bacterium]
MRERIDRCWEFGQFRLREADAELLRDGQRVALARKAFDTLLALVERAGHLVPKDELMRRVWPDAVVEEANLANNVSLLRRVLGDPRIIETVPGRGYRFAAPVRETAVTQAEPPSVAVLPFRVLGAADDEYLGLGFADALITRLATVRGLRVRPTSAVARWTSPADPLAVGRALRVGAVLEGTIRVAAERIRVTAQLVDVEEASPLWTGKFDERLSDIFAVEDAISERIARSLSEAVLGDDADPLRETRNSEAHRLYLKARYLQSKLTRDSLRKAIDAFTAAAEIDGAYARAHAGIAECWCWLSHFHVSPREALPRARAAAERALALDEGVAEAHLALGLVRMWYDWDWRSAGAAYRRALDLSPSHAAAHTWYAFDLTIQARHDEAIGVARRALALDPLSLPARACLGWVLYCARRPRDVVAEMEPAIELDPGFYLAHYAVGIARLLADEPTAAIAALAEGVRLSGRSPEVVSALAHAHAVAGGDDEARRLLAELDARSERGEVSAYHAAVVRAALGEADGAIAGLERALAERSEWLVWLAVEPRLDGLRRDRRFARLAERVGTVAAP